MVKTTTIIEKFDNDGKIVEKTTTITEDDGTQISLPVYPEYPKYPDGTTGAPYWINPVTYGNDIT